MSYTYRGRTTHNYTEYQRWRMADEAESLRQSNSSLQEEANRLRKDLGTLRDVQKDVRSMARQQARLEEQQREQEALLGRIQNRQQEYERRAEQRRQTMERELRAEIEVAKEEVEAKVDELAQMTAREIAVVRDEVEGVRQEMRQELTEVRHDLDETRRELEAQIVSVHNELQAERDRRVAKENSLEAQARTLVDWVDERLGRLEHLDPLGLSIERTRTEEHLERTREQLAGPYKDTALPVAQSAFASLQTAQLESERRQGIIEGVAEHVEGAAARLEQIASDEQLRLVFQADAQRLLRTAQGLRERAAAWKSQRHWHTFENERFETVGQANRLVALAVELQGSAPGLIQRLREREEKLKEVASTLREVVGPVDRFETSYGNPEDPKSPRLLRAYIGHARIDAYVNLEGTFEIDAYGFDSGGHCGNAAERMGRKLAEKWQIVESRVDPTNPQTPSLAPAAAPEAWKTVSGELSQMMSSLEARR